MKANRVLAYIRRGFINLNEPIYYTVTIIQVNGLTYIRLWKHDLGTLDQCQLEVVQQCVSKLLLSESYIDQLTVLNLPSLLHRYRRGDLIFLFKLVNGYF